MSMSDTRPAAQDPARPLTENLLLVHFWKLFGLAVLVGALYLGHEALSSWNAFLSRSMTLMNSEQHPQRYRLQFLADRQLRPATVLFKNQSTTAVGYVAEANEDFVVLGTVYKDDSREETIFIPWQNIL